MKLNWDPEIPSNLIKKWNDLLKILNNLDSIEVNQNVFVNYDNEPIVKRELHCFSDASLRAYGTTIYVKTILVSVKVHTISLQPNHVLSTERNHYTAFKIVRKLDFSPLDEFG